MGARVPGLVEVRPDDIQIIDSTTGKAHRSVAVEKGAFGARACALAGTTEIQNVVNGHELPIALKIIQG